MPDIAEVILAAQTVLAIRHEHVNVKELPELIGHAFEALGAYVAEKGGKIADVPYVAFYGLGNDAKLDENDMTIEVVFPLRAALPSNGRLVCREQPGETAAQVMYTGAYDISMESTYMTMVRWIQERGGELSGWAYESYRSGPDVPKAEHVTLISVPYRQSPE